MAAHKHYVLHVLRAQDLTWESKLHRREPNLYVSVRLGGTTKDTPVIKKNLSPEWNETLTFSSANTTSSFNIQVKHDSAWSPDPCIGHVDIEISELMRACESGEAVISLFSPRKKSHGGTAGTIFLRLQDVDLVSKADADIEALGRTMQSTGIDSAGTSTTFARIGDATRFAAGGDLYKSIGGIIAKLDPIRQVIDDVSRLHPYLDLAWHLTSMLYKSVSKQFQTDKRVVELARALEDTFNFVKDIHTLLSKIRVLERYIIKLLETTSECCQFLQEYLPHSFARRMLSLDASRKIDTFMQSVGEQKNNLGVALTLHNTLIASRTSEKVDVLFLRQCLDIHKTVSATRQPCLKDTRVKYRRDIIDLLTADTSPRFIWLHGVAGSGKSTIATSLEDYFRDTSQLGGFLQFEVGKSEPSSVIREIAFNLALFDSSISSRMISQVDQDKSIASALLSRQFQKLLLEPLSGTSALAESQEPVVIILDALDECGSPQTRAELLRILKNELPKFPPTIRFLVTSRPEPDIVNAFSSRPHYIHEIELDYASDASRRDVLSYLKHELHEVLNVDPHVKMPADWPWKSNIEQLGKAAGGLFIWASTAIKLVSTSDNPFSTLKDLVSDSRSLSGFGLDELYGTVLRGSGISWNNECSKERFSSVLAVLLFSKIPLSNTDIDCLLGFPPNETSHLVLSRLRCLLSYSPDMPGMPVRLFHASFSDYLQSSERSSDPWFIDISLQKSDLAMRCFVVMEDLLHFNMCDLETSFVRNEEVPDLKDRIKTKIPLHLDYVCTYWAEHLVEVATSSRLLDALSVFAHERLLFWFEVLSLLKKFRRVASRALSGVAEWAVHDTTIYSFLNDASSLATIFAEPISRSTPHIYVSMLPLTNESELSSHYPRWTSSMVRVEQRGDKSKRMWLKVLEGHTNGVRSVCFSPDGKRIASGSFDKTVRICDAGSGELVRGPLEGHESWIRSVAISRDGKYVASGSDDGTIRIWDLEKEDVTSRPLEGHTDVVTSVTFSPDGKYVVSGSWDNTVRLWDAGSGIPVFELFKGHTDRVWSVAFSPTGRYVASGSADKTIRLWDVGTGNAASKPFTGHADAVYCIAFSPDGAHIASGSVDRTIRIWDVATREVVSAPFVGHTSGVWSVAYSSDGQRLVSGSDDSTIRVWDVEKAEVFAGPFMGHMGGVRSVQFSPDGLHVVSGSLDKTIRVWRTSNSSSLVVPSNVHTSIITSVAFSPDDSTIASGSFDNTVRLWDIAGEPNVSRCLEGQVGAVRSVAFSPDGSQIISGSEDGTIRVWECSTGVAISGRYEGHIAAIYSVSVSSDGAYIASGSADKTIRIWDLKTGNVVAGPFVGHTDIVFSVAFSPDGSRVVSGSFDGTLILWDTRSGNAVLGPLTGHLSRVFCVAFSPDGRYFASGFEDKAIRIWNASTGDLTFGVFEGHSDSVYSIAFSPDGTRICSGSYDCTARVWDVIRGDAIFEPLEGHVGSINSVAFSHDGKYIASVSDDKTIRVWDAEGANPTSDACKEDISNWEMTSNGWICSRQGELLLWVPPDLRSGLFLPRNTAIFGAFWIKVDFRDTNIGSRWRDCFKPTCTRNLSPDRCIAVI